MRTIGAGLLSLALLLAMQPSTVAQAPQACTWSIGIMGALSGDYKRIGEPMANGIRLAADIANREGGLPCTLTTRAEDSQGDPNQSPRKARALTEDQQVVACICGFFSGETLASGNVFERGGLIMVSTGTNRTIKKQGFDTWFRAIAADPRQARATVAYIKENLRARKVVTVHDGQDYSEGLAQDVGDALGSRLRARYRINPEESDYSAVVSKIKRVDPDVVYYGGYTPQAGALLRQLHEARVGARFVVPDGSLDDEFMGRALGRRNVDMEASCPCSDAQKIERAQEFAREYEDAYGEEPGIYSADTFDVANIAIDALGELTGLETTEQVRAHVVEYFDNVEHAAGTVKSYDWSDRGELKAGADHVFVWKWDNGTRKFEMLGRVSELTS